MMNYGNYGCEYDGEQQIVQPWLPPPSENILHFPVDLLWRIRDQGYTYRISVNDAERIQELKVSISRFGILKPCVLYYDSDNNLRFQDGNHRLIAVMETGLMTTMPCVLIKSEGYIQAPSVKLYEILSELTELMQPVQDLRL